MKARYGLFFARSLVVCLLIGCACLLLGGLKSEAEQPWHIVTLSGTKSCCNFTMDSGLIFTTAIPESQKGALVVRDGDLLYGNVKDAEGGKDPFVFPWKNEDGNDLNITVAAFLTTLAGKPVSLVLGRNSAAWDWLKNANKDQLTSLRMVTVDAPAAEEQMESLKRLAELNPHVGLLMSADEPVANLAALFKPEIVVAENGAMTAGVSEYWPDNSSISYLSIRPKFDSSIKFLSDMSNLTRLDIGDWQPFEITVLPELPKLESLSMTGKFADLSAVKGAKNISELTIFCDNTQTEMDLAGLADFPKLRRITLVGENYKNIPDACLSKVQRIVFLGDATQEQFARMIETLPELREVQVVISENITDLSPLKRLAKLEALVWLPKKDATPETLSAQLPAIEALKQLRFVMLPKPLFENVDQLKQLQEALPNTTLSPGVPLCLGSGWILLLIPAATAGWAIRRLRRPA